MKNQKSNVRGADVIAALVVGFFAGAAAMYAFNRTPTPIVGSGPMTQVIPTRSEPTSAAPLMKRVPDPVNPQSVHESPAEPKAELPTPPIRAEKSKISKMLNVNTATQAELELLPEVGPSLAKAIVAYRDAHGPFVKVEDLDRVKGIGPKVLARISPLVTVGSELP